MQSARFVAYPFLKLFLNGYHKTLNNDFTNAFKIYKRKLHKITGTKILMFF